MMVAVKGTCIMDVIEDGKKKQLKEEERRADMRHEVAYGGRTSGSGFGGAQMLIALPPQAFSMAAASSATIFDSAATFGWAMEKCSAPMPVGELQSRTRSGRGMRKRAHKNLHPRPSSSHFL